MKWDPDCTVSWKHTSRGFSVLLLIKTYPPQGLALSFSSWVFKHLWWVRCSWLHCSHGDIVLVLLAVRHPCTHSAVVWRSALVLMQTTRSECGRSVLVAWCILEPSSFILPRQLPFVQVCAFLITVYRSQGKASYLHSILILAQTILVGSEWWIWHLSEHRWVGKKSLFPSRHHCGAVTSLQFVL